MKDPEGGLGSEETGSGPSRKWSESEVCWFAEQPLHSPVMEEMLKRSMAFGGVSISVAVTRNTIMFSLMSSSMLVL